ncbi:HD domain-containing protein [Sporolactobacillus sp. CQH2019]|uniref:HD-GYP domain-containing protein n=1 Tax=Sporolactobacillus sp. CQH2019 TaxID=3023512 RepID=UPI002367788F|nr:HD domain-containing phosphohydrolase [Sporolactobacillus sp. CQH2019]MDD9148503.1 HD domain-containing protein [Sporolactobacillus sp. CQH2019]
MLVKASELEAGYVLKKDVYAKSDKPLIRSGTVLEDVHLAFLKAFLIDSVEVETKTVSGRTLHTGRDKPDRPAETSDPEKPTGNASDDKYQTAVSAYRSFFRQWQSGSGINIGAFRKAVMPLLADSLNDPIWIARFLLKRTMIRSRADRSVTMGFLSAFLGKKLSFSQGDVYQIGLAGMLADCGLAKLPPSVLNQEENSTVKERLLYERHVTDSYKMLKDVPSLRKETLLAVIQHHEREDGSGYPLRLNGERLSSFAKVLAVCDSFLHYAAASPENGGPVRILDRLREASYGKLSGYLLDKFCDEVMTLFIGSKVVLSDGREGKIIFIPAKTATRPLIRLENNEVISLSEKRRLSIDRIVTG